MSFDRNESLLPMEIDDGRVIFCNSISGGAQYRCGMPKEVGIVLRFPNGTEKRARYHLSVTSINDGPVEEYNPPTDNPPHVGEKVD